MSVDAPPHTARASTNRASETPNIGWIHRILRTPLLTKIVLLDLAINIIALSVMQTIPDRHAEYVTALSLGVVLVMNAALVAWALLPLRELEETARRVANGEYSARTRMPPMADRNLVRIGDTLDGLLDSVAEERARVRKLASLVVATGDQERARIARELHDGTAQSLSALEMLLATTLAECPEGPLHERVITMREIVCEALSEVRTLSHAMHPRVLDDLGLPAAMAFLGRRVRAQADVQVRIDCRLARPLPVVAASALYRIAQEASHNAVKHGAPSTIDITLRDEGSRVTLRVVDDGSGFDRSKVDAARGGMGLFVMEERASLADGTLTITSRPGRGAEVRAVIPIGEALA